MKSIIATLALLFAGIGAASAETIDLPAWSGFGSLHQYHGVPTSAGPVTIYVDGMQLYFDDQYDYVRNQFISYWVGKYAGNGLLTVLQKCVFAVDQNGNAVAPCQLDGETLEVTLVETHGTRCGGSGRGGGYCHPWWKLQSGTIVR